MGRGPRGLGSLFGNAFAAASTAPMSILLEADAEGLFFGGPATESGRGAS